MDIKVDNIIRNSIEYGDGIRYVILVHEKGYKYNDPVLDKYNVGTYVSVDDIIADIMINPIIQGITIAGGNPLYYRNISAATELCRRLKSAFPHKSIWLYTSYNYEDIKGIEIMKYIDVVVDGKYNEEMKDDSLWYMKSTNQRMIDVRSSENHDMIVKYDLSCID